MQVNNSAPSKSRVIVYIDGFNLYFGLKTKKWKSFYWLNIRKLSEKLITSDQELISTKYFTSRISLPPDKSKRQSIFIEALETLNNVYIYYGHYFSNTKTCSKCGNIETVLSEKMTDVNIAVEMLTDAFQDKFDVAILISTDSDLSAPVKSILQLFPDKKIIVYFPPERFSYQLKELASTSHILGKNKFIGCEFPDEVTKKDGYILKRPERWITK